MIKHILQTLLLLCLTLSHAFGEVFYNPIIGAGADPSCQFFNGNYYYMQTDGGVNVRKAPRIVDSTGLNSVPAVSVYTPAAPYNQNIWAPEIKYINGNWYIYYTAGTANDPGDISHRMFCLKADTSDPQGSYTLMGRVYDPNNDLWAIDGNVLQKSDGSLYFVWCGRSANVIGPNRIYIAPMSDPWTISGPRVLISNPIYSWENGINEAPAVIQHNSTISIVYSANCSCGNNYCLGLIGNRDGNVLNPSSWTKNATPIFQSYSGSDGTVYAPGSCTFTKSLDGTEDWIIYHTAQYSGSGFIREIHTQKFSWTPGYDTPSLGHPIPNGVAQTVPSGEAPVELTTTRASQLRLADGRMQVFTCQYPDGSVWTRSENTPGGTWGNWSEFPNTSGFHRLEALQWTDGTLTLFGVGDGTAVWINWQNSSNGPWNGFVSLVDTHGNGANFNDFKAFKYADGRCAVFAMDGNQIWSRSQFGNQSAWGDWSVFPGTGFTQVSPILLPDNSFLMFGVGNMTQVWINWQLGFEQGWSGWEAMGGFFKNVRTFRYDDGRLSVFAGNGDTVWNNCQYTNVDHSHWGGWQQFDGSGITQYDPIKLSDERFALLAISGTSIWQDVQTAVGQGWTGWTNLGGGGFSKVEGNQLPDGRLYYFGNGLGSPEWFRYQAVSNGVWNTGWTNLGGSVF